MKSIITAVGCFVLVFLNAYGAGTAGNSLTDGLVAYYPFNGNANDESGNGNHGTIYGATLTRNRFGESNSAYLFASGQYIEVPNSSSLMSPTNAITLSVWARMDAWYDGVIDIILCKRTDTFQGRQYCLYYANGGPGLMTVVVGQGESYIPSLPAPTLGQWHHITATHNSGQLVIYLNGRQIGSKSTSINLPINTQNLLIGKDPPGADEYFIGALEEIRIYNRALSSNEVWRLYLGISGSVIAIDPLSRSFSKQGGGGSVYITATNEWGAATSNSFISITAGTESGVSNGTLTYLVSANFSADTRSGYIYIGDKTHTVNQAGYDATLAPTNAVFTYPAATGTIAVSTLPGISWTAVSQSDWISVLSGASGVSTGVVTYAVQARTNVQSRTGSIRVAGKTFTVTQTGVATTIDPYFDTVAQAGGIKLLYVTALGSTAWSALPSNSWLYAISGGSGSGDGVVTLYADANPSYLARTGRVGVLNSSYRLSQGGVTNPVISINPTTATAVAVGAFGNVAVTATPDAPWTAQSNNGWLQVTAGGSGAGTGMISYVISANTSIDPRTGTMKVVMLGRTNIHTVTQAGHVGSIAPTAEDFTAAGGSGATDLSIHSACAWTIVNSNAWVSITSGSSGSGNAQVTYTVAANNTVYGRTGLVTIAGQRLTITQGPRWAQLDSTMQTFGTDGGAGTVNVTTESGAWWETRENLDWITIHSGQSGTGNGAVIYIVSTYASPLSQRMGVIEIAGQNHYVNQMGYTASIDPDIRGFSAEGGSGTVAVNVPMGAVWEAIASTPWISIIGGQSGSSSGTVTYVVLDNNGDERAGTIYIAGQPHQVTQSRTHSGTNLPYAYEQEYWPEGNSGGAANDFDLDGFSNWQEWWAGTNPTNSDSRFVFQPPEKVAGAGGTQVSWPSATGRTYRLLWITDLLAPSGISLVNSNIPATPMLNVYTDAAHAADAFGFYKVEINP